MFDFFVECFQKCISGREKPTDPLDLFHKTSMGIDQTITMSQFIVF